MATYTTIQGDTWDMIAFRLFGEESRMKELAEANRQHMDTLVFGSGTVLSVPDIEEARDYEVPFWREDDPSDDAEAFFPTEGGDVDG